MAIDARLAALTGAHPDLVKQPGLVVSLAQSPGSDEQIKAIASLASVTNLRKALESIPADRALQIWDKLSKADRERLKATGYKGVDTGGGGGGGLFGKLKGAIGGALGAVGDVAGGAVHALGQGADAVGLDTVGREVLHAANWVPENINQWVRAEHLAEQEAGSGVLNMLKGDVRFWSNPGKYWAAAADGNKVYDLKALEAIRKNVDPRMFELAKLRADGDTGKIRDTLLRLQESGDAAGYEQLAGMLSSHDYNDLADKLNDAKISFGRNIARTLGVDAGSDAFNVVSGTLDGTMRVLEDPLTYIPFGQLKYGKYAVAGSVGSRSAVMSDSVQASARIEKLFANKAVQRGTAEMGQLLERVRDTSSASARASGSKALDDLKGKYGQWAQGPLLDALVASEVKNTASFREFLDHSEAMSFLIRGQSATRQKILPYRTARAEWVASLPLSLKARWIEEGGRHRAIVAATSTALYRVGEDLSALTGAEKETLDLAIRSASGGTQRGKAATVLRRGNTRLPVMDRNTGAFSVTGAGSIENFNNLASSMVPKLLSDRLTAVYATADVAGRKQIIKGLADTTIRAYGLEGDALGREVAAKLLRSYDDATRPASYTLKGAVTSLGDEAAVYAHQMSPYVYLPNFREFATALAKVHHANGLLNMTNHHAVDSFTQQVWRPMILLRPALAFRNATEETLNNLLRTGVWGKEGLFAQYAGAKVTQQGFRNVKASETAAAHRFRSDEFEAIADGRPLFKADLMFAGARAKAVPAPFTARELHDDFDGVMARHEEFVRGAESSYNRRLAGLNSASAAARADMIRLNDRIGVLNGKLSNPAAASTRGDLHGERERLRKEVQALTKTVSKTDEKAQALARTADPAIQEARAALSAVRGRVGDVHARVEAAERLPRGLDEDAGRMWRATFFGVHALHGVLKKAHAPDIVLRKLDHRNWASAADLLQARALAKLGEGYLKTANPEALKSIEDLVKFLPEASRMLSEDIAGGARRSAKLQADQPEAAGLTRRDGQLREMRFVHTGQQHMDPANDQGLQAWSIQLHTLADEPAAREALRFANDPATAVARVMAIHARDRVYEAARWKAEPERWAQVVVNDVRDHLSGNDGMFNEDLWRTIVRHGQIDPRGMDVDRLAATVTTKRPAFVNAPDQGILLEVGKVNPLVPLVEGSWKLIGDMTATIARNHQMIGHYVAARQDLVAAERLYAQEVAAARSAAAGAEPIRQHWTDASMKLRAGEDKLEPGAVMAKWEPNPDLDRMFEIYPRPLHGADASPKEVAAAEFTRRAWDDALHRMLEYVDNPDIRSQAAVLLRNVSPFYRAQEEFYRRWFNIARYSPKAVWRAHLALDGANDGGLIQDDPVSGQKVFVYPGSGAMAQYMADLGRKVGMDMNFFVPPGNFTGKLQTLAPGFDMDQNLHPFSGPVLAFPLMSVETLTGRKEARWAEKAFLSKYGYDEKPIKGLVPSWVKTFWPNEASQAAATKQAIAALAMGGITLPDGATEDVKQEYWDKVKMHAKAIQLTKAIFGTTLPSFPQAKLDYSATGAGEAMGFKNLKAEFYQLAHVYGQDQAYALFTSLYPNRVPLVVSVNDSAGGMSPPVDPAAARFMEAHAGVLGKFPKAAAYLIPVGSGEFDQDAWNMARGMGMFKSKSAEQYAADLATLSSKKEYFAQRDEYEKYRSIATAQGDSDAGKQMDQMWKDFSKQFQVEHPLVAKYLADGAGRRQGRKETVEQLRQMVVSAAVPPGAELNTIRLVLQYYDELESIRARFPGSSDYEEMVRRDSRREFVKWLKGEKDKGDSTADRLYSGVFRGLEGDE